MVVNARQLTAASLTLDERHEYRGGAVPLPAGQPLSEVASKTACRHGDCEPDSGCGMLVLVAGPSGAGKSTLLAASRAALAGDPRYIFIRRAVTRPAGQGAEDDDFVADAEFEKRCKAGGFALHWRAQGVRYGVPSDVELHLAAGRIVVVKVSRIVIADAVARFPISVIEITAPADLLARRLAARGRGDAVDAARRLSRTTELPLPVEREIMVNDGTVEQGTKRLLAALSRAAAPDARA